MAMAAILVMRPKQFELTSIPQSHGSVMWNLTSIGVVVIEEKKFENIESDEMSDLDPSQ